MSADVENIEVDPNPSKELYLSESEKQAEINEIQAAQYWLEQVTQVSKQEAQPWADECRSAWREFQGQKADGTWRPTRLWWAEVYPRYWSDTELMLPALYSRTPKAVSRRKFDSPDPNAKVATIINDRLAAWLMQTSGFDDTMESSALGFLNTNRQTCRIFYEEKVSKRKKKIYVTEAIGEDGQPILLDPEENLVLPDTVILNDENGLYFESEEDEEIIRPRVITKPVQFDKLRISPGARNPSEIWWIAYEITITKKDAAKLFGDKIKNIQNPTPSQTSSSDWDTDNRVRRTSDLFTYWELWNYRDKQVYWLHEQYKKGFLKKEDDIYHLQNFFPSPKFMLDNMRYDSCYPAPDYTQCKDAYEQMHILYKRINLSTRVLKSCILFDGAEQDLANFFRELSDNQGIGVSKWAEDQVQGGFANKIFIPDFSPIVLVLQQLVQAFERQKVAIDELRGITDIIRGASEPETSATAEKIKDRRSSLRFAKKKKAMLKFAVETLQMMLDLAYKTFDDEYIKEITGVMLMSPEDQRRVPAALEILRNDEERQIRIDIETDSMVLFDDMDRKEQSLQLMGTVGEYIKDISRSDPVLLPALVTLLGKVIRTMDDAREAEDPVLQAFTQISERGSAPPQPPQPNPDVMAKITSEQQIRMFEIQSKERLEMAKLGQASARDNAELQIEGFKATTGAEQGESDLMIKAEGNQIKREELMSGMTKEQIKAQLKVGDQRLESTAQMLRAREAGSKTQIELARLEIEKALAALKEYETTLTQQERWITEMRLQEDSARSTQLEEAKLIKELETADLQEQTKQVEAMAKTQSAPQVVNITGDAIGLKPLGLEEEDDD